MLKQTLLATAILGFSVTTALAQSNDKLTTEDFGNGIYMLVGAGGNVGVLTGDDGTFVIDDKYDRVSDQIISIIKGLTDQPITYVINTHYLSWRPYRLKYLLKEGWGDGDCA